MEDKRIPRKPGPLQLPDGICVEIGKEAGRGNSCIVYQARLQEPGRQPQPILLKEFCPTAFAGIVFPDESGLLRCRDMVPEWNAQREEFRLLHQMQQEFYINHAERSADELVEIIRILPAGDSVWVLLRFGSGYSWDQIPEKESIRDILETILSTARELEIYHCSGFLHGDIKPANIYLFRKTRQHVRLLDFGSVQRLINGKLSGNVSLSYSYRYCAPEILDTEELAPEDWEDYCGYITEKADVYSLTAVLQEKLTDGFRVPDLSDDLFREEVQQELQQAWELTYRRSQQRRGDFLALGDILCRGLARDPKDRLSLTELITKLEDCLPQFRSAPYVLDAGYRVGETLARFVGRRRELQHMKKAFLEDGVHALFLTGGPGMGKTTLAEELARYCRDTLDVYRVRYDGDLVHTIADLTLDPRPPAEDAGCSPEERYRLKIQCLQHYNRHTVLILDNFDPVPEESARELSSDAFRDLMQLNMHILVTTRGTVPEDACRIYVGELSREESGQLFRLHYRGAIEDEVLDALLRRVCSNTLLTELLAKNMEHSWGLLEPEEAMQRLENGPDTQLHSQIRRLYDITVLSDASRELLAQAALFPGQGLHAGLCLSCQSEQKQDRLRLLEGSGWVKKTPDNRLLVHPLIQQVLRETLSPWAGSCQQFVDRYALLYQTLSRERMRRERLALAELTGNLARLLEDPGGRNACRAGELYHEAGHYRPALEQLLAYWNAVQDDPHLSPRQGLATISRIAWCCDGLGDYKRAVDQLSQGIQVYRKMVHQEDTPLAMAYENLGSFYQDMGWFPEAQSCYLRAGEIYLKLDRFYELAHLQMNLSKLFQKSGQWEEAGKYGQKALEYFEKFPDPDSELLQASCSTTLGILREQDGNFEEALGYYRRAGRIYEQVYGPDHPQTAGNYSSQGVALTYLGEFDRARDYLEKARKIKEALPGLAPDSLANTYHSLADLARQEGKGAEALQWCDRAMELRIRQFGPDGFYTVPSYRLRGGILYGLGRMEEALEAEARAYYVYDRFHPWPDESKETILGELLTIYEAAGYPEESFGNWLQGKLLYLRRAMQ